MGKQRCQRRDIYHDLVVKLHQGHKSPDRRAQDRFRRILIADRMLLWQSKNAASRRNARCDLKADFSLHKKLVD